MAHTENPFDNLSVELRKRIIYLAGSQMRGSWTVLAMVDKQFRKDCAAVGDWNFGPTNEFAFLDNSSAMVGVQCAAVRTGKCTEPLSCLRKVLGEAGPTIQILSLEWDADSKLDGPKQDHVFGLLAGCPNLHTLILTHINGDIDLPTAKLQGLGFQNLRTLSLFDCSLVNLSFQSLPALQELYLEDILSVKWQSIVGLKLTSLTLKVSTE